MGQSAEELRRDIERTRDDLGETFDAIGERVSPGRMVQRRKDAVRNRFRGMADAVMGTAHASAEPVRNLADSPQTVRRQTQGNPLAAGLIAFGGGLLLATLLPATKQETRAASALQDHMEPIKERALEAGQEIKDNLQGSVQDAVASVKDTAMSAADEVKGEAGSATSAVGEQAKSAAREVKDQATP
jgi:hypothetical protein